MMFLGLRKLGNICCGHKIFLNKIRNIFVSQTQNLCFQQMLRARANRETFVSATMCPPQCVLVCQGLNPETNLTLRITTSFKSLILRLGLVFFTFVVSRTNGTSMVQGNGYYVMLLLSPRQELMKLKENVLVWMYWKDCLPPASFDRLLRTPHSALRTPHNFHNNFLDLRIACKLTCDCSCYFL